MKQYVLQTPFGVHHTGTKEEMESLLNTIINQIGEYVPPTDDEILQSSGYPDTKDYMLDGELQRDIYDRVVENYVDTYKNNHLRDWKITMVKLGDIEIGTKGELFPRITKFGVLKNPEIRVNGETFMVTKCSGHITIAAYNMAREKAFELVRANTPVTECSVNDSPIEFRSNIKHDLLSLSEAEEIVFGELKLPHTEELNKFLVKVAKSKIKERYDNVVRQASLLVNLLKDNE